jgi:hypothetical protein
LIPDNRIPGRALCWGFAVISPNPYVRPCPCQGKDFERLRSSRSFWATVAYDSAIALGNRCDQRLLRDGKSIWLFDHHDALPPRLFEPDFRFDQNALMDAVSPALSHFDRHRAARELRDAFKTMSGLRLHEIFTALRPWTFANPHSDIECLVQFLEERIASEASTLTAKLWGHQPSLFPS